MKTKPSEMPTGGTEVITKKNKREVVLVESPHAPLRGPI